MLRKIGMIFLLMAVCLAGCGKSVEKQIAEQLELGNKYLTEANYEQAIVAFNKVIELDPKQSDAYIGLTQVYVENAFTPIFSYQEHENNICETGGESTYVYEK